MRVRAGDLIFLSPDYRVDPRLAAYARDKGFRSFTTETRRNYATDIGLLLDFLWRRGRAWTETQEQDLEDFEHWRRQEESNPARIGGTKGDRELAAFMHLFKWAVKNKVTTHNPVATKQVMRRYGQMLTVPAARCTRGCRAATTSAATSRAESAICHPAGGGAILTAATGPKGAPWDERPPARWRSPPRPHRDNVARRQPRHRFPGHHIG
ncbi:site-specific integrase [Nonomuraea endophytica]|uniref:Core-binding (CB) domain-containing protein n=1 Tax=Nonomuraea endophytica TaxID=714136 RepID=A0A7W8EI11_9ACTN|nr:site-specific integrase [Nonomuraea endophytica]MBB5081505.1 hypothetical protein [Nonomuraea endophytica]